MAIFYSGTLGKRESPGFSSFSSSSLSSSLGNNIFLLLRNNKNHTTPADTNPVKIPPIISVGQCTPAYTRASAFINANPRNQYPHFLLKKSSINATANNVAACPEGNAGDGLNSESSGENRSAINGLGRAYKNRIPSVIIPREIITASVVFAIYHNRSRHDFA